MGGFLTCRFNLHRNARGTGAFLTASLLRGLVGFGMIHDRSEAGICCISLGSG